MNRNRLILLGVLALALAGITSFAVYRLLLGAVGGQQQTASVVVAATDLGVGASIQESDLKLASFPIGDVPKGVFHKTSEVVGRGVLVPLTRNEPILVSKIAGQDSGAGLPALIPDGMRAVSVKVNDVVSVAGFVQPGTRVDVLLTGRPFANSDMPATTTVLENVLVMSAGPKLERDNKGQPVSVPVITLLVSPEDAQKLTLASSQGQIQLALRNPVDLASKQIVAVNNPDLYNMPVPKPKEKKQSTGVKKAVVVPPPSAAYLVEIIRGDKREETKF